MEERNQQQQTSGFHVHTQLNVERDARTLGWIMVGQLLSVTLCDGNEPRFFDNSDTNTETEQMTTEDDEEGDFDPRSGLSKKRGQSPEPQDTIVGRVYSYDYIVKLLILKTVRNPGTPEETYADSVMINVRNIKNVEVLDQGNTKAFTQDELVQEFAMGDQSTLDQRRIVMAMQTKVQERVAMLKRKKIELKL